MCGIVAMLDGSSEAVARAIAALRHRGPDGAGVLAVDDVFLGHTRLAVIDPDPRSDQPFRYGPIALVYNGELWNYRALRDDLRALGCAFRTGGDTEVVAAALATWGPAALARFEGMFALAWTNDGQTLHVARDRFGEVPVHATTGGPFAAASEVKALRALGVAADRIGLLPPGHHLEATRRGVAVVRWYDPPITPCDDDRETAAPRVRELVTAGAAERTIADVPVCTLLSGGVDSAAVAAALVGYLPLLVAYTAVFDPRSRDLRCAREVAAALGVELREVCVPTPSAADLARMVSVIELPHKAQVEIAWPCLKLAERIRADGFKVTCSGEGSDELWASYGFAYHGLKGADWHAYRKALVLAQARKNFIRCNKVFLAHAVECRLPFLHRPLVEYALSLRRDAVQDGQRRPKAVLQDAFAPVLPASVVARPKVAFQDGLGLKQAIGAVVADPARFYAAEFRRFLAA